MGLDGDLVLPRLDRDRVPAALVLVRVDLEALDADLLAEFSAGILGVFLAELSQSWSSGWWCPWTRSLMCFLNSSSFMEKIPCPVPDLTLLFFNPAKDIPEAAETVTSGAEGAVSSPYRSVCVAETDRRFVSPGETRVGFPGRRDMLRAHTFQNISCP
jgi:hypothetical protein